jgi:hypothetical protein
MMGNGKIIGAVIAVAAIGLISYWLLIGGDNGATVDGGDSRVALDTEISAGPAAIAAILPEGDDLRIYMIDAAESEVYWRVYRAGALARLGHNHVISLTQFDGSVTVGSDVADAVWELSFPVNALVIDDPELRARYGEDFESVPREEDKEGTKENMLTDGLLDGANFPEIRLEGSGVVGSLDAASLPVSIHMLGRTIEQNFPASISITADSVNVQGEYRMTHADFGLEPFSLLGGAMAVGAEIDFTYRLRANVVSP